MLIWIKASCVAIGVLVIFVLVLSTVASEEVLLINSTSEFTTRITLTESAEVETVLLMQLPFASNVLNPCSSETTANRQSYIAPEGHRASFAVEFYRFISHFAKNYEEDAQKILQNHTINGCAALHVTNLPDTPTLEQLQTMDAEEALNRIYSSLLMHSAYAYFIHHQFVNSAIRCSEDIHGEQSLADEALSLALKQKSLACTIRVGIAVLGYNQYDLTELLNVRITDLTLCSRRALRDCQVINSIHNFLKVVADYASELS